MADEAIKNQGQWADKPAGRYKNATHVANVYPNPVWFVAMEWAPEIKSLRDLKGKRVSVGLLGSQGESVWRRIMEIVGLTYDDVRAEYTVHQDGIDQARNRQIDAVVWPDAAGSASITQLLDTGFGRLVDMDADVVAKMTENSLDYPYEMPAGAMPGQTEPVKTWASAALLMVREDVDEALVYDLVKTMFTDRDYLINVHPIAQYLVAEQALESQVGEVHPGAARYYREIGVLT